MKDDRNVFAHISAASKELPRSSSDRSYINCELTDAHYTESSLKPLREALYNSESAAKLVQTPFV